MSRKFASFVAAFAIAAVSAAPALAEPVSRTTSIAVSYADLDLSRAEGVQTLSHRLKSAIDQVCGKPHDTASQTVARKIRACRATAMDQAVAAIDAPLLTALRASGEGRRIASR